MVELFADTTYGTTVVLAEVGDGLEVGHQAARQPHRFNIAQGFTLQATT